MQNSCSLGTIRAEMLGILHGKRHAWKVSCQRLTTGLELYFPTVSCHRPAVLPWCQLPELTALTRRPAVTDHPHPLAHSLKRDERVAWPPADAALGAAHRPAGACLRLNLDHVAAIHQRRVVPVHLMEERGEGWGMLVGGARQPRSWCSQAQGGLPPPVAHWLSSAHQLPHQPQCRMHPSAPELATWPCGLLSQTARR